MDQWRERGFVPDSDSDSDDGEEFEGLGSFENWEPEKIDDVREVPKVVIPVVNTVGTGGSERDIPNDHGENEEEGSQVLPQSPEHGTADASTNLELGNGEESDTGIVEGELQGGNHDSQVVPQAFEPEPVDLEMEAVEEENDVNEQETEHPDTKVSQKPASHAAGGKDFTGSEPANKVTPDDRIWEPSSSPDELQFEEHITPKKVRPLASTDMPVDPLPWDAGSGSSSPLSSPPSSIESLPGMEIQDARETSDRLNGVEEMPLPDENPQDILEIQEARETSSPLDDVANISPLDEIPQDILGIQEARETSNPLNNMENMPPLDEIPRDILETAMERRGRQLRQRNPIQLHPYLLEDARYQTLLKTRGLRPMRIQNEEARRSPKPNDETQDQSFEDNNPPSSSQNGPADEFQFPPPSPVAERRHNIPAPSPRNRPQARKSDYVRRPKESVTPNRASYKSEEGSSKRRKLTASYGKKNRSWVSVTPTQRQSVSIEIPHDRADIQRAASNVPPSPPASRDIPSSQNHHQKGFRFPPDIFDMPLNTPTTEPRTTPKNIAAAEIVVSSENEGELRDEPVPVSSSESEAENPSQQEELEDKRLRRQIRRVLPASWVRVDLKRQESSANATQKRQASSTLRRDGSVKGVAKRIKRTRNSSSPTRRNWRSGIPISDESDSDNEPAAVQEKSRDALAELMGFESFHEDQTWAMDDDIPEDNRIDDMFPPIPRQSKASRPKKSSSGQRKQPRNQERSVDQFPTSKRSRMRQTDIASHVRKSRSTGLPKPPKPKLPRLGILDAPDMADHSREDQPQFMRIAARQARSRRDKGRGSPCRKFLRLGSKVDTTDANMSLYQWKSGSIRQNKKVKTATKPRQAPGSQRASQKRQAKTRNKEPQGHEGNLLDMTSSRMQPDVQEISGNISTQGSSGRQEQDAVRAPSEKTQRPGRPVQSKNNWVVNRNLPISSLRRNATRSAQLEVSSPSNRVSENSYAFKRSLDALNRAYNQPGLAQRHQLARFLGDSTPQPAPAPKARPNKPRQPRKHRPRRIDAEAAEHRQPEIITVEDSSESSSIQLGEDIEVLALHGFSVGSPYPIDFDIMPLQFGTFFHESTFIGSGEFSHSLNVCSRDLDKDAGVAFIPFKEQMFKWGQWNETVSSELSHVIDSISQEVDKVTENPAGDFAMAPIYLLIRTYRSIVRWISKTLSFADPDDRLSFVGKCLALGYSLMDKFPIPGLGDGTPVTQYQISRLRLWVFVLAFLNQARQISSHDKSPSTRLTESNDAVKLATQRLLSYVLSKSGLAEIRRFQEDNKLHEKREIGIGEDHPFVEAYLTVQTVLTRDIIFKDCFEDYVSMGLLLTHSVEPETCSNIHAMERIWYSTFTILPLDEIDESGIFQIGSRFEKAHEHWKLIKRLLSRVLGFYSTNPRNQSGFFNAYCRILFHRCFYLMNSWGWKNCKIILDTLFDFFANNTLHHLRNEQSHGSPSFLENLDKSPNLEVEPRDCCFHIFLKIVGRGLQLMSSLYEKKKIRNFAWRLLPNHGRIYPKDEPLQQEDLDALKNHHDLLCTLYWATPDGYRPRLETIRDLVHPASSHREACGINIRTWARLARFKLSTEEDITGLEAFAEWHSYFINEMLKQHSVARTEIETQDNSKYQLPRHILESAITQNQRQIESILNSALNSLKDAIDVAKTMDQANVLVAKLPIVKLLGLFNSKTPRINTVVCHALDVVMAFICTDVRTAATSSRIDASEDSQDFGDWTVFEDIYEEQVEKPDQAIDLLDKTIRPSVSRLVSNCFGEDQSPDDTLLLKVVKSWTSLIQILVKHRRRFWSDYLNDYDGDSWTSLRETAQTRKFAAHFLASLVEKSEDFYNECKNEILVLWVSSLVERDTVLKFQHQLTNALLNVDTENPLFQNLPFSMDRQSKRYEITLGEFRERRLSLISSLLSNMQRSLAAQGRSSDSRKEEYRALVKKLMDRMKTNYEELRTGDHHGHRPYVDFVQRVVEFLQQYAQGICPIDSFFTSPTTFPLPATDPTYIVARLKSYGLGLSTGKVSTQLITFIQSVSERAVVDGEQIYLVDQLFTAMSGTFEAGDYQNPTLRSFVLHSVFPAYVENVFHTPSAWIVIKPVLQSTGRVFRDLLLDIDVYDEKSLVTTINMISIYLEAIHRALCKLVDKPKLIRESFALLTLPSMFETITSVLPVVDYIERVTNRAAPIISYVKSFRQFSIFAVNFLLGRIDPTSSFEVNTATDMVSVTPPSPSQLPKVFHAAREYASRELTTWLKDKWTFHGGKYYVRRMNEWKEINVTLPDDGGGDETASFFTAVELFFGTMEGLEVFPRMERESNVPSKPNEHRRELSDEAIFF